MTFQTTSRWGVASAHPLQHNTGSAGLPLHDTCLQCISPHGVEAGALCSADRAFKNLVWASSCIRGTVSASCPPCTPGAEPQELEGIVSRAVRQAAQTLQTAAQVPEDVFWYAQRVGAELFYAFPVLVFVASHNPDARFQPQPCACRRRTASGSTCSRSSLLCSDSQGARCGQTI